MNNADLMRRAKKKVRDKKQFYAHLNVFCIVTFSLFLINYFTTPGIWWFILLVIGWAVAVFGHYINVFGLPSFRDSNWEETQLEIELDKLKRSEDLDIQNIESRDEVLEISNDHLDLKELRETPERRRDYNSDDFV